MERINEELDADFEVDNFEHLAYYNENEGRIEMHLRSQQDQVVNIEEQTVKLDKGETIHTENSYKYTIKEFQSMAQSAGFIPRNVWTDSDELFSVHYFEVSSTE